MLSLCLFWFSIGKGDLVIWLSQINSLFAGNTQFAYVKSTSDFDVEEMIILALNSVKNANKRNFAKRPEQKIVANIWTLK